MGATAELIGTIARLEAELPNFEDRRREAQAEADKANSQYTIGLVGLLLGIILLFFLWPLGILLVLAGGLAAATQASKRSGARTKVADVTAKIEAGRKELGEAKAQAAAA